MVSFSLKKADRVEKKGSFGIKKKAFVNKSTLLSNEKILKDDGHIEITTFDAKKGAFDKNEKTKKKPLVIKQDLKRTLTKREVKERPIQDTKRVLAEGQSLNEDEAARRAVLKGESSSSDLTIPLVNAVEQRYGESPDEEAYERIPVDSFGEALLRGMGWKGDKASAPSRPKANSSSYLGLGAKHLPELDHKDKDYSPLVRRKKQT